MEYGFGIVSDLDSKAYRALDKRLYSYHSVKFHPYL